MDDDVKHSGQERYALSQAYRWRAERDKAMQELRQLKEEVEGRLMPEGMEWLLEVWPRWSSGEYCKFGDWWTAECYGEFEPKQLRKLSIYTPEQLDEFGQGNGKDYGYEWDFFRPSYVTYHPVKVEPPAPKVLAADGEPLEVGQTVWDANGDELVIGAIEDGGHTVTCRYADVGDGIPTHGMWSPSDLTHQRPVLDADGVPIREWDTVWNATTSAGPFTVREIERSDDPDEPEDIVWCGEHAANGFKVWRIADQLTHTKPEIDTWGRIEDDAGCTATKYNERRGTIFTTKQQVARDLVRRCRALAERERGE